MPKGTAWRWLVAPSTIPSTAANSASPMCCQRRDRLSFSQAPKRPNLPSATQCIQSTQDNKTTICAGVKENTSITIASRQTAAAASVFGTLQPNVDWLPANTVRLRQRRHRQEPRPPATVSVS